MSAITLGPACLGLLDLTVWPLCTCLGCQVGYHTVGTGCRARARLQLVMLSSHVPCCVPQAFDQYLRDVTVKLNRKVEDLDDVRHVMGVLREVRETEANIETLIAPIDDMYSLLMRCGPAWCSSSSSYAALSAASRCWL